MEVRLFHSHCDFLHTISATVKFWNVNVSDEISESFYSLIEIICLNITLKSARNVYKFQKHDGNWIAIKNIFFFVVKNVLIFDLFVYKFYIFFRRETIIQMAIMATSKRNGMIVVDQIKIDCNDYHPKLMFPGMLSTVRTQTSQASRPNQAPQPFRRPQPTQALFVHQCMLMIKWISNIGMFWFRTIFNCNFLNRQIEMFKFSQRIRGRGAKETTMGSGIQ